MATSGVFARIANLTVLFVDDDEDTRFAYQCVAMDEGFDVELADDGHEAIALANLLLPDVIALDVRLPGLDGFEVIRRLRASPRTREIPIVIVSADMSARVAAAIRASGCEAHLAKPCSAEELIAVLSILGRRRQKIDPRRRSTMH